ncbi:uncharacterized protein C8A04DRAFT_9004 [Dichotomopilus funicola]|uniref:Zn(2)-C6 fungal-type domain-containing protein n=1 Tax=Dichotomopilus funicola TaxID=1934379 RepID=A0AAN6VCA4_9PEZI|nr:hypothetical protein C8A04DRAFT_9004 [Dichotomopilus funicola]
MDSESPDVDQDPDHNQHLDATGSPDSGHSTSSDATADTSPAESAIVVAVRRRPIPRKGHTKSRRGCFNCKRRKVKCQENRPECSNCTRIGLGCEYPDAPSRLYVAADSSLAAVPSPHAPLQSTPTLFTASDMRFFHHFLVSAYPPLPIRGDDLWREIAPLSHNYDYLMHAMLGLAASHLGIYGVQSSSEALTHRVKAINLLNQALGSPPRSTAEGDAQFAAMFALAFQASCMPDGMNEFIAMIKGCHVVGSTALITHPDSLFWSFTQEHYSDRIRLILGLGPVGLTPEQDALMDDFLDSLHALAPLCTSPLEVRFLASTESLVKTTKISAAEAVAQFPHHYAVINNATPEEFAPFVNPTHYPAQLLLIHFVLIEYAIGTFALGAAGERFAYREKSCVAWMAKLEADLPGEYRRYVEWPVEYVRRELIGGRGVLVG